jgi:hypothetical protein
MAVVGALVAHPSIACIVLCGNSVDGASHAAGSLTVLLAVNAPGLKELSVSDCDLDDSGLRPIVQALQGCTHLRSFDCSHNGVTRAFARDELLPAVTANASLRTLKADDDPPVQGEDEKEEEVEKIPELAQAEALVAARASTA